LDALKFNVSKLIAAAKIRTVLFMTVPDLPHQGRLELQLSNGY